MNYKIGDRVWVTADGTWFEKDGPGTVTDCNEDGVCVWRDGEDCRGWTDYQFVRSLDIPAPTALAMTGDADFFTVALSDGTFWTWNAEPDKGWRKLPAMEEK